MKLKFSILVLSTLLITSCATKNKTGKKVAEITPEIALQSYLDNDDHTFQWEVKEEYVIDDIKAYDILLTSQHGESTFGNTN